MKAIIMAGGEGSRLRPLTCDRPKPMVPVMNRPVMEHIVALLAKHGLTEIAVTLQYLPEAIVRHFGDGSDFGVSLRYFVEEVPLGTAGSVKNAAEFLDDTFLVISGDALTDFDLSRAIEFHRRQGAMATLVLTLVDAPLEYGVVITGQDGRIQQFLEKPSWGEVFSDKVNTGVYVLEPEVLKYVPPAQAFDFSKNLFPLLLKEQQPLFGCVLEGYWCDIGTLQQYQQAHFDCLSGKVRLELLPEKEDIRIGTGSRVDKTAVLTGPVLIGDHCRIGPGVRLEPYTVIGNNSVIMEQASIKRSVLWDNTVVGKKAALRGAVLGNRVTVDANATVLEGAVVGDGTVLETNAIIKPDVKIWPHKRVSTGATVSSSLIWGTGAARNLFGHEGVSGLVNQELTPDLAARIGAAYGGTLGPGARVVVGADESSASRMLQRALVAGIGSAGVQVLDIGRVITPITRFAVRTLEAKGGIHVKMGTTEVNRATLVFLNSKGANISRSDERKIENNLVREDFRRAEAAGILEPVTIGHLPEDYLEELKKAVKLDLIRSKALTIAVREPTCPYLEPLLSALGCRMLRLGAADQEGLPEPDALDISAIAGAGADLGVIMDRNADRLTLVDNRGRVVSDGLFIALTCILILKSGGSAVAVPVTAPGVIEKLAGQYNGRVVRTKASTQFFMEQVLSDEICSLQGPLSQFSLNFDALAALARVIEFICQEGKGLAEIVDSIPEFHTSQKKIDCPWEAKGRVIRKLIEDHTDRPLELLEGVKVYLDNGWALVLPDAEEPVCRVFSEGFSQEIADSLTDMYADKIKEIVQQRQGPLDR